MKKVKKRYVGKIGLAKASPFLCLKIRKEGLEIVTKDELKMLQSLPLDIKVAKSKQRIREFIDYYGVDGVYISFSGGKDSTVLLDLVRQVESSVKAVFVDTGLEYVELKEFVKSFDNVEIIRPKLSFKQVIERYGYPIISKNQSDYIYRVRNTKSQAEINQYLYGISRNGQKSKFKIADENKYLLDAPFKISNKCCTYMKKKPCHEYEKETGRHPFIGVLAEESVQRETQYRTNGCNAFETKNPTSTPLAFWRNEDILQYIKENNLPICSVYGDVVEEDGNLRTTGEQRTGCLFCLYGIHREQYPNRLQRLENQYPKIHKYVIENLGFKEVCEYMGIPYNNKNKVVIHREKTAITRNKLSRPMKKLYDDGKFDGKTVLDYGAGKGFDVEYLKDNGVNIDGFEPFASDKYREIPKEHYDVVTCNYVLNVIEDPQERLEVIEKMKALGDEVYITVRADMKCIKDTWKVYNDGYITPKHTFQKIYTEQSLIEEYANIQIIYKDAQGITFKVAMQDSPIF